MVANPLSDIVQRRLVTGIDLPDTLAMPNRAAYPRYDSGFVTYEEQ